MQRQRDGRGGRSSERENIKGIAHKGIRVRGWNGLSKTQIETESKTGTEMESWGERKTDTDRERERE